MSRTAYCERIRAYIAARGFTPVAAVLDAAGNCTRCGEAGRCPGWHIADDERTPEVFARIVNEQNAGRFVTVPD